MSRLASALHLYPAGTVVTPALLEDHRAMQRLLDERTRLTPPEAKTIRERRAAHLAKLAALDTATQNPATSS